VAILSDHTRIHFMASQNVAGLLIYLSLLAVSMLVAFCVSLITERRTAMFRDALLQLTAFSPTAEKTPAPSVT
jgi:uncharacterized membrane protein